MEQIDKILESKRNTAKAYKEHFADSPVEYFDEPKDCQSNYWLNVILLPTKEERDAFLKYSNENGVMTRPIWQLMNRLPMFTNCQTDELTNSIWFEERVVNIPSSVI